MTLRVKNTDEFVNSLALLIDKERGNEDERKENDYLLNNLNSTFKLGQIDPSYTSGRPRIIFEGETITSVKAYPYLSSYTPTASDVVLLARVGNSYIILGKRV